MLWLWMIVAAAALAAWALGQYFSNLILHIKTVPYEQTMEKEKAAGRVDPEAFEQMPKEEVWIDSPFDYKLHGFWLPADDPGSIKAVIFVHGVTYSLIGSLKYVEMFQKRGYHALVYDHRRHGKSGGHTTTYGHKEKHDLQACLDWVQAKLGQDAWIGIHGESMGAATALQHAAIDSRAAFYIADCPYSDLTEQLAYRLRVQFRLPRMPLLPLANAFTRLRGRFWFHEVSPIRDIAHIHTPILFIHGDADDYIPKEMTLAMHACKPGVKQLYLAPLAEHAQAVSRHPEAYDRRVGEFLEQVETAKLKPAARTDEDKVKETAKTEAEHGSNPYAARVQPLQ